MTIIGFEKLKDGTQNLLFFDPGMADSKLVLKLLNAPPNGKRLFQFKITKALKKYRRGEPYLGRFNHFELVQ